MSKTTTSMVNEQMLFSSIVKRLFTGSAREIVEELLQNAQRAGAARVDVTFPHEDSCLIADNGHGLVNGVEDLRAMLVLAESSYQDAAVFQNQSPMGIGLYSLIAHDEVTQLTIESGAVCFPLDTYRWLSDAAYRESWQERVMPRTQPEEGPHGFCLHIKATAAFIEKIRALFALHEDFRYRSSTESYKNLLNPACGYRGLMAVYVDGVEITVDVPERIALPSPQGLAGTYQGNAIRLSPFPPTGSYSGCLVINWYGQIIFDHHNGYNFQAYLRVRQGKPVTPRAPTRAGLIDDEARAALYRWMEDQIFTQICGQEAPSPRLVQRLYEINQRRAEQECPFALVQQWKPLAKDYQAESHDDYTGEVGDDESDEAGPLQVVRKDALETLLIVDEGVTCSLRGDHQYLDSTSWQQQIEAEPARAEQYFPAEFEIGLGSFIRAAGLVAYRPVQGVPEEAVKLLWWRPNAMEDDYYAIGLGMWGLQDFDMPEDTSECDRRIAWQNFPADAAPVFVASETTSYAIEDINWIIGLNGREEIVPFLKQYADIAFTLDEEEPDRSEEAWADSLEDLIISYLPDTIASDVWAANLPGKVKQFLPQEYKEQVKAASYTFVWERDIYVVGVTLTFPDGYTKTIAFH
jgi:hypothetical protein